MADMRRWAKVVVVDEVMAMIYHTYDSDADRYAIHCVIQADVGEIDNKISRDQPWTQEQFDLIGCDTLVRAVIKNARDMMFTPVTVGDAS